MTMLQHQITIDADIEKIWEVLADLSAVQRYNPLVVSVRYLSNRTEGVGAARHCELKPRGWVEECVWEWSPPNVLGLEVSASTWPLAFMRWKTELRKNGNSTVLTQKTDYRIKFGPIGALMDSLVMRRMLNKSIVEILEKLKQFVETQCS